MSLQLQGLALREVGRNRELAIRVHLLEQFKAGLDSVQRQRSRILNSPDLFRALRFRARLPLDGFSSSASSRSSSLTGSLASVAAFTVSLIPPATGA